MSDDVSAIVATSAGVKDMADGSLRITFEFEPRDAAKAFALFGPRGRAVAIAALRDGFAAASNATAQPKSHGDAPGPKCREACDLCKNPQFHDWVYEHLGKPVDESVAKQWLLTACGGIESRKDLDADNIAGELFIERVRVPFIRWARKNHKVAA